MLKYFLKEVTYTQHWNLKSSNKYSQSFSYHSCISVWTTCQSSRQHLHLNWFTSIRNIKFWVNRDFEILGKEESRQYSLRIPQKQIQWSQIVEARVLIFVPPLPVHLPGKWLSEQFYTALAENRKVPGRHILPNSLASTNVCRILSSVAAEAVGRPEVLPFQIHPLCANCL